MPSGRIYVHVQTEVGPSCHMEWEFQVNTFVDIIKYFLSLDYMPNSVRNKLPKVCK